MRRETKTATPPRGVFKDKTFVTIFKGVTRYVHPIHGYEWYCARVGGKSESWHDTEIEAARQVDRIRITKGLEPVNTFRPKLRDLRDLNG